MTVRRWGLAFSPFAVRTYRFQWSADLLTSCAFEMETVLLGWYIVVQTESVLLVTLFGSMQFLGTLIAPVLGLAGDRIGQRNVLCLMRGSFVLLAAAGAILTLTDMLTPSRVLLIAGLAGLIRPSETGIRSVLIAETLPESSFMRAMPLSRITVDMARAAGALASGVLVLAVGMEAAYPAVVLFYALGLLLTLGIPSRLPEERPRGTAGSPLRDLWDGARSVWQAPPQLAAMLIAFIVNVTGFPFTLGLLPYIARDVYGTTQVGLGYMVTAVALGGIVGSLVLTFLGPGIRPARTVLVWSVIWHGLVILFGHVESLAGGLAILVFIGMAQMLCAMPISVLLLRGAPAALRGRIMGMRTLAVYGLPIGLVCSGPLIEHFGFAATAGTYGALGIAATLLVLVRWRSDLWPRDAAANGG